MARDAAARERPALALDRRRFLQGAAGATLAAALATGPAAAPAIAGPARVPRHLRRSSYRRLARRRFDVEAVAGTRVRFRFAGVDDLPAAEGQRRLRGHEHAFRLRFVGPSWMPLEQGTYAFRHRDLGSFDLFVVPTGGEAWERTYEAIVNRVASRPPRARRRRRRRRRRSRR